MKTLLILFSLLWPLAASAQTSETGSGTAAPQMAAPLKIGYTSLGYILEQMPEMKTANNQLTLQQTQSQNEMKRLQTELQTKYAAYQQRAAQMSEVIRKDKETELQTLNNRIQEFARTADEGIQKRYDQLVAPLLQKAQAAIDTVAKENGYTYILSTDSGTNALPNLLYAPKEHDITELVLKKLGVSVTPPPSTGTTTPPKSNNPAVKPAPSKKN
ncbi:hypothetical protein GCM10023187_42860 [Nibrella viscosa]|uniref:Periplasmic chaperone for outer membrane proteins Skp n=1 Tax=Nibrella viscosa TaxID=1084524 RepID=A0ABP8KS11_9BACT